MTPTCVSALDSFGTKCGEPATKFVEATALGTPYPVIPYCEKHFNNLKSGFNEVSIAEWIAWVVMNQ